MFETFQLLSENLFLYQVIQLGLQALDLERDDMLAANDRINSDKKNLLTGGHGCLICLKQPRKCRRQ